MWEEQAALRKTISVYDLAEQPNFRPHNEVGDEDIEEELKNALDLLHKYGVQLDWLDDVEARKLYRFVTEELIKKEMNDIRIPGMMHCFIYEDYYPNHPYDIKNRCTEIITHLTKDERSDLIPWGVADEILFRGQQHSKEQVNDAMMALRDSYTGITLHDFTYTGVDVRESATRIEADVTAEVRYEAFPEDGTEPVIFSGNCRFHLTRDGEWWTIDAMSIPGL